MLKIATKPTAEQRAPLERAAHALKVVLNRPKATEKKLQNLRGVETKVLADIEKFEGQAEGGMNEEAVNKLVAKREQLRILRISIAQAEEEMSGEDFLLAIREAIQKADLAASPFLQAVRQEHLEHIAGLLAPYCENAEQARGIIERWVPSYRYVSLETMNASIHDLQHVTWALGIAKKKAGMLQAILEGGEILPAYVDVLAAKRQASAA